MSPLLLYILTVIQNDMKSQPKAYRSTSERPMDYLMDNSIYHRNVLATEPIPWSYT